MPLEMTPGLINSLNTGYRRIFANALTTVEPQWRDVAMDLPTTKAREVFSWLGSLPTMKEWITERRLQALKEYDMMITVKNYENTVRVDLYKVADDEFGFYDNLIELLGVAAAQTPDELIFALFKGGFTVKTFDGEFFFDTDHPIGDGSGGTWSNKGTTALSAATFETAVLALTTLKNDQGITLSINRDLILVVPPQLRIAANTIVGNAFLTDGTNNPNFGVARVLVAPQLAGDANNWYLISTGPLKPFIMLDRMAPQIETDTSRVFMAHEIIYGGAARWGAGYGLPYFAYGANVA